MSKGWHVWVNHLLSHLWRSSYPPPFAPPLSPGLLDTRASLQQACTARYTAPGGRYSSWSRRVCRGPAPYPWWRVGCLGGGTAGPQTWPALPQRCPENTGAGIILCMPLAHERQRYNVTSSLIGWARTQNNPCRRFSVHHSQCAEIP